LGWIPHPFDIRGGQTGYIHASGYNVAVEIADKNGHVLDIVVLGAASNEARFEIARDLAAWTFENFEWP
jgi:D-alanyl-D-alanine carboxypeptidase